MNISASIRKLTLLFVMLFVALSAGLVYWQVVVAQQVTGNIHNARPCLPDSSPVRGRIFDRNGVLLAESLPADTGCGYIRHYTEPSLAALIGYYVPGYPATGIEAQFNDYLSGQVGQTALNNQVNKLLHRPPVGADIYLTIDVRIQRIVNRDFDTQIPIDNENTFASNRGSVIVTDPHSGQVLAMLSRPSYDPNKLETTLSDGKLAYYNQLVHDPDQPLLERPIQSRYVPGSTYKTMTLLAGLDAQKTTLDQPFTQKQAIGPIQYNGQNIGPIGNNIEGYTIRFPVSTSYGFAHSDNIIFAQIGVNTGFNTWLDYNKRLYVGQQIPFDLPVTPSTVLPAGQDTLANNQLAANAFGQGTDFVTPMQMSLIDNVVANNGQLMRPMLVMQATDRNKNPVQTFSAQALGDQPQVSSQTATQVRQAMYGVVRCGSGLVQGVQLVNSPWGILAKTGTAQVGGNQPAHSWLITQAPYSVDNPTQLPKLTIVAMKENGGEGGSTVGPMVTAMYNDIFTNVMKAQMPTAPNANYCCSAKLLQLGCPA
jgi:penicillin-binding protein A